MEDAGILELFLARSEEAVKETEKMPDTVTA